MKKPEKILAVKLADLGDALQITPALRALHTAFPEARIDVLTTNGRPVLEGLPYVNRVLTFDKHLFDQPREALRRENLRKAAAFLRQLRAAKYDTLIFFHHFSTRWGTLKYAALARAVGARTRLGLDNGRGWWFLNQRVRDRGFDTASEGEQWLRLVEKIGAQRPNNLRPEIVTNNEQQSRGRALRYALFGNGPVVAIHAGGGDYSLARRWLPVRFAETADLLVQRYGLQVAIVGGPDEVKLSQEVRDLMQHREAARVVAGMTNLKEMAVFLKACQLFIGNDGGLMHLAAAMDTPTIGIFGPTNPVAWQPYGTQPDAHGLVKSVIVQAPLELPCRPCLYRGQVLGSRMGCAARPCLTAINPSQVVEAASQLLSQALPVK